MSNYEYLRSLSLKELATEIVNMPISICSICVLSGNWDCNKNNCIASAAEWLESERETEVVQNGG